MQHDEGNTSLMLPRSNQSASSSSSSPSSSYSSSTSLARTFRNWDRGRRRRSIMVMQQPPAAAAEAEAEAWSMSSLLTALPESPSPICSHASSAATTARTPHFPSQQHSDATEEFSSPRNQSFGIAYNENINNCFSDIDEWLEHANRFCKPSNSHTNHLSETVSLRRNASPEEEEDLRISAICSTFLTAPEHELYNITLPSIREESPAFQGSHTRLSCIYGPSKSGSNEHRRLLLSRPKPYGEFLSDAARKKHEVERDARNKAKHVEIMHRMKRKEDAIDNWELQQTRKAMSEMDKIQNQLERKQLRASAKTQKKICSVREKAEKQKLDLRRSTMKRFQQLQKSETNSPTENSWGSRLPLC